MIAKRVERKSGSRYANLISYLLRETGAASASHEHAVEYTKITNCNLDEADLAVKEIEAAQALNTRSKIDRTYHLVVSFPTAEKPTPDQLEDIESDLCQAIGLGDHQRISVAHKDTENFHVHVAINKIHPETYRAIEPYYDKYKLDSACAELERKHGLKRVHQLENQRDKRDARWQSGRAGDMEAHRGQDSFKRWLSERKDAVAAELASVKSWPDAHRALANHGLSMRPRGAGLVIANQAGDVFVKASGLGRDFSKAKLEGRLGDYQPLPEDRTVVPAQETYQTAPPQSQNRNKPDSLWEHYQKDKEKLSARRTHLLQELRKQRQAELKNQKSTYGKVKLGVFFDRSLSRAQKSAVVSSLATTKLQVSRDSYHRHRELRARILSETTPQRWLDFLRERAHGGDRAALQKLKRLETQQRRQQPGYARGKSRAHGR